MTKQIDKIEKLTQEAICEVFAEMLSMPAVIEPPVALPTDPDGEIIGSVGFIGQATGIIYLYAGMHFARVITSRMLGIEEAEVENEGMVNDAIGELSNMVVGFVKSRLCDSGWECTLTIPSVVSGQQLSVNGSPNVTRRMIGFASGEHHLVAEVLLKESGV